MRVTRGTARSFTAALLAAGLAACGERAAPVATEVEAVVASLSPAARVDSTAVGDWPGYNRDLAGTRFSPLAEIDVDNVANLVEAWRYALPRHPGPRGYELTPLVFGGVLYAAAADRVVALDAGTGRERWRHPVTGDAPSPRGVAYWPGDAGVPARLFFTAGRELVALDAATGEPVRGFGANGRVEMPHAYEAAPTRFDDLLIVGSSIDVRAFDARTGIEVWAFGARPPSGATGESDAPVQRHEAQPAFSPTVDPDRALVYAALAGRDEDSGLEAADEARSGHALVALEARTGTPRWHFRTLRHDRWDHGVAAAPGLLDVTIAGRTVPLLALPTKQGYMFVLHRVTGEPLFGVEERAVPASGLPEEGSAETEPVPAKPPPLARVSFASADLVTADDTTEEHARACGALVERNGGLVNEGPFTPYLYRGPDAPPRSTVVFPGARGGAGWGGTAADPRLAYVFVNTSNEGSIFMEAAGEAASAGTPYGPGDSLARFAAPGTAGGDTGIERAWPCQKPPWGQLTAVNLVTGDIAWQVPLGITAELPARRQRTGRPNAGGPVATAGGLVLIGATDDRRFRAFASHTGEQLWATELPRSAHAVPITYLAGGGKQYVAIVAGGGDADASDAPTLIAYALP